MPLLVSEPLKRSRVHSDRVRHPHVRQLALRAELVDRGGRHVQRPGNLSHGQESSLVHLGGPRRLGYQGDTKRRTNPCQTLRLGGLRAPAVCSVSSNLRTVATPSQLSGTDCHAGGQGFESPTPRQFGAPQPAMVAGLLLFSVASSATPAATDPSPMQ